jgi:hypothetical protein
MNINMKKIFITLFILFFSLQTYLIADAEILEFQAEPSSNKITLNWRTGEEKNITSFYIERSSNNNDFTKVGEVSPTGSNSRYEFVDESISRVRSIYYYRLKVVNNNGTNQLSESLPVIPNVSSIKRTWGSIKALFR